MQERNPVERIKRDKAPLGIREQLPALIAAGYEAVAEEDIVRLQWWGLYHDKPKLGTFMLRLKLPAGQLTPARLRAIGAASLRYGRGEGELSTRQCVQLHRLELAALPQVLAELEAAGITTAGGCGDTVRNITGGPVALEKARGLAEAGARVTVVAAEVVPELRALPLELLERPFVDADVAGRMLVVSATGDDAVARRVAAAAARAGVCCNTADVAALCSFILPAVQREGPDRGRRLDRWRLAGARAVAARPDRRARPPRARSARRAAARPAPLGAAQPGSYEERRDYFERLVERALA